jgi:hypothetical protein
MIAAVRGSHHLNADPAALRRLLHITPLPHQSLKPKDGSVDYRDKAVRKLSSDSFVWAISSSDGSISKPR